MLLKVSVDTIKRFIQRISQLYEQGADNVLIGKYMRHWCRWVSAGVALQLKPFKGRGAQREIPPAPPTNLTDKFK